ncbi:MAG: SDR family oxidoreductase [Alphaproteobacteria bacterium]|nr:SDR family oxidoreductase [Alphaproteobacteria bacterium]
MSGLFGLEGRVVVVTGASSGIGRSLSLAYAQAGARVVVVARRAERLHDLVEDIGASAAAVPCDLLDRAALAELGGRLAEPFGAPEVLVNAAGLNPRKPAEQVSWDDWDRTLDINLAAPFFLARQLVPAMLARGWGRVINIASLQSKLAFAKGLPYGASKGGVAQLTRAMAEAWSPGGVNCNAIAPGFFPTELTGPVFADPEASAALAARTMIGRNGRLEDLHGPALFLSSPASDYVTGQVLYVDGGFTAK